MSPNKNPTRTRNVRLCFHLLAYLVFFVPHYLPLPFAPEFLHDLFGAGYGGLITVLAIFGYALFIFLLALRFLFEWVSHRKFNDPLLFEIGVIPLLLILLAVLLSNATGDTAQKISALNAGKNPSEFQNPYLSYKMLDCRNITEHFDVIFIPQHFGIEIDYLAYAPKREKKAPDYKWDKSYGSDWYLENSGSMWSNELGDCYRQNRSPN